MTQPRNSFQVGTGLFILLGFAALAYLATQTTSVANYTEGDNYLLKAKFSNIGQLKVRAPVKLAGVRIGSVQSITLDPQTLSAIVMIGIDKRFAEIPDDSAAAIFTSAPRLANRRDRAVAVRGPACRLRCEPGRGCR